MRKLRRILIIVAITLTVIFVSVNWVAPVALSFYASRKAPQVTRVVPQELKDLSISRSQGMHLSYFGYEFEVPWNDLDETKTKLYPIDKPSKLRVDLSFRSGLRLIITDVPPHSWASEFRDDFKLSAEQTASLFGDKTMKSDYSFAETLYEFTPDKMNRWAFFPGNREGTLLLIKSLAPPKCAETGIFRLRGGNYRGFQLGDPRIPQKEIVVNLYSDEGSVEFSFRNQTGQKFSLVSQPEINRIIQTLRSSTPAPPKT